MKRILITMTVLSIYLNATPVTLNNTGLITKLEKFTPICTYYSKTMNQPLHIRQLCKRYNNRLDDILKTGYRLDRNIVSQKHTHLYNGKMHTCTNQSHKKTSYSTTALKNYRTHLLSLDKLRDQIIEDVSREKSKARRSYDVAYHEKLIREDVIRLYDSDKTFISEHWEAYTNNPRYIKMLKDKDEALLSQEQREYLAQQQKEEERRNSIEDARWHEMCSNNMTAERHHAKKGGKLTGRVTDSQNKGGKGYFVETLGGMGATFFVVGGPLHTKGEYITSPIHVASKGETRSTTLTNSRGVKTEGSVLVVEYNDKCTKGASYSRDLVKKTKRLNNALRGNNSGSTLIYDGRKNRN